MLNPITDRAFMGIEYLVFGIGMVQGETGKSEKIGKEKGSKKAR